MVVVSTNVGFSLAEVQPCPDTPFQKYGVCLWCPVGTDYGTNEKKGQCVKVVTLDLRLDESLILANTELKLAEREPKLVKFNESLVLANTELIVEPEPTCGQGTHFDSELKKCVDKNRDNFPLTIPALITVFGASAGLVGIKYSNVKGPDAQPEEPDVQEEESDEQPNVVTIELEARIE